MSSNAAAVEKLEQGWQYHRAGDFARAEGLYRETLEADASRADVWHLLGSVRHSLGRPAEAAECFQQALSLKPDYSEPRNFLAVTLVELHRLDEAVAEFRRAIALRPGDDLSPRLESFLDTAAVLENLDLLICCDTSLAHLAGALGRPAWVALPHSPDWRWLLDREDSPWYPSLRLFRQRTAGEWHGVFARMAAVLSDFSQTGQLSQRMR